MKKKVTISDIARELNTTASTVSRALSDDSRISNATKMLVWKKVRELQYQPNSIASALRKGKSNVIGVIVPTSDRQFFASFIRGIEEIVRDEGYRLIICQSDEQYQKECAGIDSLLNIRVDGIIASVAKNTVDFSHFKKIEFQGVPLVLFDRVVESMNVNLVYSDDYYGAYRAVTHLIEQGCRRIAHFAGKQHIHIYQNRLKGYLQAIRDHHLPVDDELIIETDLIHDTYRILEIGRVLAKKLSEMPERPDAIFSSSDFAAMGALQFFKENNIAVPHEMALVGYSNDFSSSVIEPSLTTLDQHTAQMGNEAARHFLNQIKTKPEFFKPRKTLLKPELIIRNSSLRKNVIPS